MPVILFFSLSLTYFVCCTSITYGYLTSEHLWLELCCTGITYGYLHLWLELWQSWNLISESFIAWTFTLPLLLITLWGIFFYYCFSWFSARHARMSSSLYHIYTSYPKSDPDGVQDLTDRCDAPSLATTSKSNTPKWWAGFGCNIPELTRNAWIIDPCDLEHQIPRHWRKRCPLLQTVALDRWRRESH
jgi:hypothetical protein